MVLWFWQHATNLARATVFVVYHRRKIKNKNKILPDGLCGVRHSGRLQNKHDLTPLWASAHFKNMAPLGS
jgi:hypothetical protein